MGLLSCCSFPRTVNSDSCRDAYVENGMADQDYATGSSKENFRPGKATFDFGMGDTHRVIKLLGKGAEGEAWLMQNKKTGEKIAVKLLLRPFSVRHLESIRLETKIQLWMGRGCINVVPATGVVLTKTHLGILMEYEAGGDMASYIGRRVPLGPSLCMEEDEARYFFMQLINAIEYCHKHCVAHRDLKLDNILLDEHNPPWIKLCDFGFAKPWGPMGILGARLKSMLVGTPDYMGPEVIRNSSPDIGYDGGKADMWSMGVLLYVMLTSQFPFDTVGDSIAPETQTELTNVIWAKQNQGSWQEIQDNALTVRLFSDELRDMLDQVFELDPDKRIDVSSIRSHPWMTQPLTPKYQAAIDEQEAKQRVSLLIDSPKEAKRKVSLLMDFPKEAKQRVSPSPPPPSPPPPSNSNSNSLSVNVYHPSVSCAASSSGLTSNFNTVNALIGGVNPTAIV